MSAFPVNGFSLSAAAGGGSASGFAAPGPPPAGVSGSLSMSGIGTASGFAAPAPPPAGTSGTPYSSRIARISACRRSIAASSRTLSASLPFATPIEMSKDSGTPGSSSSGISSSRAFDVVAA